MIITDYFFPWQFTFEAKVNNQTFYNVTNSEARAYRNVKVYGSLTTRDKAAPVSVRHLYYVSEP